MYPRSVTTITPQRISFAGGGTDLPDFYRQHGGAVLSATIDKFIYVTVKRHSPLFNEAYRLSYSKTEHVDRLDEIQNDVARECLRLVHVDSPLFISTAADLPASSGLGSSSSFAVGLLYALHVMRGESVSAGQLAEEACQVEIDILKHPIGKQDQYAAAFGGFNYISFNVDDRVQLDHLWLPGDGANLLFNNLMLFWTGIQRNAVDILENQREKIPETLDTLIAMKKMTHECRNLLLNNLCEIHSFGKLLNKGWIAKKSLADQISTDYIDQYYQKAIDAGCLGGKIAGAGGGGFLLLVVPENKKQHVRNALSVMTEVAIRYEPRGSRILSILSG